MTAPSVVTLDAATIEAIAERTAELLREQPAADELVDAAEIARRLGVDRSWVYENAARLGARRISDGPRSRLRFDPGLVAEALAGPDTVVERPRPGRRARRRATAVELLPIGGKR